MPESKMAQKQLTLDMLVLQNNRIAMVLSLIQVKITLVQKLAKRKHDMTKSILHIKLS